MKCTYIILGLILLTSCGQVQTKKELNPTSVMNSKTDDPSVIQLPDKTVKFLWREMQYNSKLSAPFYTIMLNQDYIKTMTDPEKAALGYVATFVGNDCWWDGEANEEKSNLDCKIITTLGLGYQCSNEHLGFLRKWFSKDKQVLSKLEKSNCPKTPYTATIQDTFDEIQLTIKNDTIIVFYSVGGVNIRKQTSWKWSQTDYFEVTDNALKLVKKDKSEVLYDTFEMPEE